MDLSAFQPWPNIACFVATQKGFYLVIQEKKKNKNKEVLMVEVIYTFSLAGWKILWELRYCVISEVLSLLQHLPISFGIGSIGCCCTKDIITRPYSLFLTFAFAFSFVMNSFSNHSFSLWFFFFVPKQLQSRVVCHEGKQLT